jgi:GH15 family glucan-1,4-alpha-glucosidase
MAVGEARVGKDGPVALPIEGYALIGDTHTAALVGLDGSVDWLCVPRFDSGACFAALLGDESHGHWRIAPAGGVTGVRRRYRPDTLVLETEFDAEGGTVRVTDCMTPRQRDPEVVRLVECVQGRVDMRMELVVRFDYGSIIPWVRRLNGGLVAVGGPDSLYLWSPVETRGENFTTVAEFTLAQGQDAAFVLTWRPSHTRPPRPSDARAAVEDTDGWWRDWASRSTYEGRWSDAVLRSLITLKALTYAPTGGIVAASTTSLPEQLGGPRNWDYRFCWVRDATFTLNSLMTAGYHDEAIQWRDWLLRAAAGHPADLQIMYGAAGERRLIEVELDWLPGYEGSRPVRVGNAAARQRQVDVFGELMDSLHQARSLGLDPRGEAWNLQLAVMEYLEGAWREPDNGIWEVRGPRRHFTHSKVMAWVAMDRAVKAVERFRLKGPVERWRALRDEIHEEVCAKGWNDDKGSFTQFYGSDAPDASLLMIPLVGFLPPDDPRARGTVETIERELSQDGFVLRYHPDRSREVDGLPPGEGAFLACSFWLADDLRLLGSSDDAWALFERLLALRNDVGLLSEEYDVDTHRLVGNFPQAFSHVSLVNTARNLSDLSVPARSRKARSRTGRRPRG